MFNSESSCLSKYKRSHSDVFFDRYAAIEYLCCYWYSSWNIKYSCPTCGVSPADRTVNKKVTIFQFVSGCIKYSRKKIVIIPAENMVHFRHINVLKFIYDWGFALQTKVKLPIVTYLVLEQVKHLNLINYTHKLP